MKKLILIALFLFNTGVMSFAQALSIQERLGYSKNTKLLIIHADDLGLSHSENIASITAMKNGSVNSGSILVPSPWFLEIAEYARNNTNTDLGIHLAITSEWKYYKWGPVSMTNRNSGIVDDYNYFFDNTTDVKNHASVEEVERELRAQIEVALKYGIKPTHLDTHMSTLFSKLDFLNVYIKLGNEYKLPVLLSEDILKRFQLNNSENIESPNIVVNKILTAFPNDFKNGLHDFYIKTIKTLEPGINVILLHAAYDNDEMQSITVDHLDWGATWRQQDFDFFTSDICKRILKEENIQLITWREIKNKLID